MEVLFIVIQVLFLYSRTGESVRCFECTEVPSPISCGDITTCEASESCFLEQVVTTSGHLVYNSGCQSNERCSVSNGRREVSERSSDIVTCQECCNGNFCNNKGCGNPEIARPQRGIYCYNCPYLSNPADCEFVSICESTEKCITHLRQEFIGLQEGSLYNSECEQTSACNTLEMIGKGICCDDDFCNDFYNASLLTGPVTQAPTDKPTNAPTVVPATVAPTEPPTVIPATVAPTEPPTVITATVVPTVIPTVAPTDPPTAAVVITTQSADTENYWIGLWDRDGNDRFYWMNNVQLTDSDWGTDPQQPTHVYNHKDEDCVYIYQQDEWHDTWCSHKNGYICERT